MAYASKLQYNPFTLDELIKPVVIYNENYDKTAERWEEVASASGELMGSVDPNTQAYKALKDYNDTLKTYTDDFSRGMNYRNKAGLQKSRRAYYSTVAPIKKAQENYEKFRDDRFKLGPDVIFQQNVYSIDDFMNGKRPNDKYESRDYLTKRASREIQAAFAEMMKDPEFKKAMGDQYYQITQHTGGSWEQMQEAFKLGIMDNPIMKNKFSEVRQKILRDIGAENYDSIGQQQAVSAIDSGMYDGLDKPATSFQTNRAYDYAQQERMQINAERRAEARRRRAGGGGGGRSSSQYFHVDGLPDDYVIDKNGNIFDTKTGNLITDGYEDIREKVRKSAGKASGGGTMPSGKRIAYTVSSDGKYKVTDALTARFHSGNAISPEEAAKNYPNIYKNLESQGVNVDFGQWSEKEGKDANGNKIYTVAFDPYVYNKSASRQTSTSSSSNTGNSDFNDDGVDYDALINSD